MLGVQPRQRGQIALEFIVVYSVVLVIFVIVFALVTSQRAASLSQQQDSFLQIVTQDVASQINIALASGSGYASSVALPASISSTPYALYLSSAGTVTANMSIGSQVLNAQSSSSARNLVVNGTPIASDGRVTLYRLLTASGSLRVYNYLGTVYVNSMPPGAGGLLGGLSANVAYSGPPLLDLHAVSMSGAAFQGARIGVVGSYGTPSSAGPVAMSALTDSGGNAIFSLPAAAPNATAHVYALGLNGSAAASLVLWLPLFRSAPGAATNSVIDLGGQGSNGTIADNAGTVSSVPWTPMQSNVTSVSSARFNGQNSLVVVGAAPALDPASAITVSAWVYLTTAGTEREAVSRWGTDTYVIGYTGTSLFAKFRNQAATEYDLVDPSGFPTDTWVYVAATFDGSDNTATLYRDGVPVNSLSTSGTLQQTSDQFRIGGLASSLYWGGSIANVQVYNSPLTAAQVQELYGEGAPGVPLPGQGLAGWWPLTGNADDYSRNADNGNVVSVSFGSSLFSSNSPLYVPNMTGGYGSYGSGVSSSSLGVSPVDLGSVDFTVNQWFMLPNSAAQSPIVDIYNGTSGSGIGGGQGFDFAGSWAGGPDGNFTWMEYSPTSPQRCSTASGTIRPGAWYDAAVSVSGYTDVSIYIDGQLEATCSLAAAPSTLSFHSSNLMLGVNDNPPASATGNSIVSDVEVYSTALDQQQVQSLYSLGLPLYRALPVP